MEELSGGEKGVARVGRTEREGVDGTDDRSFRWVAEKKGESGVYMVVFLLKA